MLNVTEPTLVYLPERKFRVELPGGETTVTRAVALPIFFKWKGFQHIAFSSVHEHDGIYRIALISTAQVDQSV